MIRKLLVNVQSLYTCDNMHPGFQEKDQLTTWDLAIGRYSLALWFQYYCFQLPKLPDQILVKLGIKLRNGDNNGLVIIFTDHLLRILRSMILPGSETRDVALRGRGNFTSSGSGSLETGDVLLFLQRLKS